jgi:hypothetical protein
MNRLHSIFPKPEPIFLLPVSLILNTTVYNSNVLSKTKRNASGDKGVLCRLGKVDRLPRVASGSLAINVLKKLAEVITAVISLIYFDQDSLPHRYELGRRKEG